MKLNLVNLKVNKNNKDYIFTFLTEFIVLCLSILVYKFSANILGKDGFPVYTLTRRTVSFIQPMLMIGIGVALTRFIAFCMNNKKEINFFLISSFILYLITSLLLLTLFIIFKLSFSKLFFNSTNYSYLIIPLIIYIITLGLHSIAYSYFRGRLIMLKANFMQLINIGLIPILSFLFFKDLLSILVFSTISVFVVSFIFIYPEISFKDIHFDLLRPYTKTLFNYGIRRTSGDITLAAYFTIPAYLITHKAGIITGGYVAFAITLINMFGAAFTPICLILLPKASIIIQNKDFIKLKKVVRKLVIFSLSISIIGVLIIEIFIPEIVRIYLGEAYVQSASVIRVIIIACIGYTVFVSLRSIIDAYYIKAVNTNNTIFSFLIMCLSVPFIYFFKSDYYIILWLFALSINILGLLTFLNVMKIIKINS